MYFGALPEFSEIMSKSSARFIAATTTITRRMPIESQELSPSVMPGSEMLKNEQPMAIR